MSIPKPMTHKVTLSTSGAEIILHHDPLLKLFLLTDCGNFGPHIIRVKLDPRGLYHMEYLLGGQEDILGVARFLAPFIMEKQTNGVKQETNDGDQRQEDEESTLNPWSQEREILMSISLRNHDPPVMREVAEFLKARRFHS